MEQRNATPDCHKVLRRALACFYSSIFAAALSARLLYSAYWPLGLLLLAGSFLLALWGWAYGAKRCLCPHCGGFLGRTTKKGRRALPPYIPSRCPVCGEKLF